MRDSPFALPVELTPQPTLSRPPGPQAVMRGLVAPVGRSDLRRHCGSWRNPEVTRSPTCCSLGQWA
ncbi:MAG: hypothetical protein WBG41_02950, partial [Acidimicrobiales bacterium]